VRRLAIVALPSVGAALLVFGYLNRGERASRLFDHPATIIAAMGAAVIVAGLMLARGSR